jgi:putative nucleotidyltransferase with HDIG domain
MGQPMEHAFLQTWIALRLGETLGLPEASREPLACGSLLAWVGCHVDAYEQAKWFGDEAAAKAAYLKIDPKSAVADLTYLLRNIGAGLPPLERLRALRAVTSDWKDLERTFEAHGEAVDGLAQRLGMDPVVRAAIEHSFERWDGRGPHGVRGQDIERTSRVIVLADVAVAFYRIGGVAAATDVARARSATQFDPEVVVAFCDTAGELFGELDAVDGWQGLISSEPSLCRTLTDDQLDTALEAVADYSDVKSPFTLGHSRAVADLAAAACDTIGARDASAVRRAGLLHDLGRLGVSNRIWDKPGALSVTETERVRMHPYLTERALAWSPGLAPLAVIAVQHHERMDGSGYPRGMFGAAISRPGRLLAAADTYQAKLEPRPHRPAGTPAEAAAHLAAEAAAGRLDGDAVTAVLTAAGHRPRRRRETAGLTPREIEVLNLLARGHSTPEIAAQLWITRKTASSHVEHIYAKLGVNNRAIASLRAVQLGLID